MRPICLSLLLLFAAAGWSQQQTQPEEVHEEVDVDLVDVSLSALDSRGAFITDLRADELVLQEDGVPQKITHFTLSSQSEEEPIQAVILIDTSVSMNERYKQMSKMEMAKDGALQLLRQLQPEDTMMLMTFSETPAETIPMTSDRTVMEDGIRALKTDYGRTALLDAVYLVAEKLKKEWGRKVIFICSDGQDNASLHKPAEVLDKLKESPDTMVVTLGTTSFEGSISYFGEQEEVQKGEELLHSLADTSGGYAFLPKNMKDLGQAMTKLQRVISSSYFIGYSSSNQKMDGSWRTIQITCKRRDAKLRYRAGYFAR